MSDDDVLVEKLRERTRQMSGEIKTLTARIAELESAGGKAPRLRCSSMTKAGKPCTAPVVGDTGKCLFHGDPKMRGVRRGAA